MKRLLVVLLICALLLVSCLGEQSQIPNQEDVLNKNDPVIIDIWTYYNSRSQEVLDYYIKRFNETEGVTKGIIVRQVAYGEIKALTDALISASEDTSKGSQMPDLFITYKGIAAQLPISESLVDFKQYISEEEFSQYVDAFVKSGSLPNHPDKHQMFSIDKASEVLMINATAFDEFVAKGILSYDDLKTYESLAAAAKRYYEYTDSLTEEPHDGKVLFGANALVNLAWICMAEMGHDITRFEDGKEVVDLDKESFRRFYQHVYIPYVKGYYDNKNKYVTDDIRLGHTLVGQSSTSSAPFFPKEIQGENGMIPIDAKVAALPKFEGTTQRMLIQGGGVFGYKRSDKSVVASVAFLKWLTNEENALDFAVKKSYMPALKSVFNKNKIVSAYSNGKIEKLTADTFTMLIDLFEQNEVYEPTPTENYESIRSALSRYLNDTWKTGRDEYMRLLDSGMSSEEASAQLESDEAFELWFQNLNEVIGSAVKK
ncbi:MAG: ABC transporter substrate-binding protein [Bacillota bacterium]|nr:ABC transporter substrate-binding protein [Bacillota bacterium]